MVVFKQTCIRGIICDHVIILMMYIFSHRVHKHIHVVFMNVIYLDPPENKLCCYEVWLVS
jgi:hypothetical protein